MKKIAFTILMFFVLISVSNAQGKFGLGIIVGEPTGLSVKGFLSQSSAFDAAIGWSFYKYGSTHIHADYLQHFYSISPEVPLYAGIGGRLKLQHGGDELRLGVRIPLGIAYMPSSAPIDLFLETVPMLDLVPSSSFTWNAAIGVRYYFH